jgi:hypothetical protein
MRTHLRFKLEFLLEKIELEDNSKQKWWKILFMFAFWNTENLLLILFRIWFIFSDEIGVNWKICGKYLRLRLFT